MRLLACAVVAWFAVAGVAAADDQYGKWRIETSTSPLTGEQVFTASLDSDELLRNQIEEPEHAQLVVHCQEGSMSTYIQWPQVIYQDTESSFAHEPQTIARTRLDDANIIKPNYWEISEDGAAAGKFGAGEALLASFAGGYKLVVRIGGSTGENQDATFEIDGVRNVQTQALSACGMASAAPRPAATGILAWGPMGYTPEATFSFSKSKTEAMSELKAYLASASYAISIYDEAKGAIATGYQEVPWTDGFASCAEAGGGPLSSTRGVRLQIQYVFAVKDGTAAAQFGIRGFAAPLGGGAGRPLQCAPAGPFPRSIYDMILSPPAFVPGKPTLGFMPSPVSAPMAAALHQPPGKGLYLQYVRPDGAAARAGLKLGDVVYSFDGKPIDSYADLTAAMAAVSIGQTIKLQVLRNGQMSDYPLTF